MTPPTPSRDRFTIGDWPTAPIPAVRDTPGPRVADRMSELDRFWLTRDADDHPTRAHRALATHHRDGRGRCAAPLCTTTRPWPCPTAVLAQAALDRHPDHPTNRPTGRPAGQHRGGPPTRTVTCREPGHHQHPVVVW